MTVAKTFDLLIKRASLRNHPGKLFEIGITNGRIAAIDERVHGAAEVEIDAENNLVSESFVNPHLHLCKVYTLQMMDEEALRDYHESGMGKAMTAIELAARVKERYDASWIIINVRRAISEAVIFGCTHVRAFADVDNKARLEGVKVSSQ